MCRSEYQFLFSECRLRLNFRGCALIFSRSALLFSRSALLFNRPALLFSRSPLLFSRSPLLFSRSTLLFSRFALLSLRLMRCGRYAYFLCSPKENRRKERAPLKRRVPFSRQNFRVILRINCENLRLYCVSLRLTFKCFCFHVPHGLRGLASTPMLLAPMPIPCGAHPFHKELVNHCREKERLGAASFSLHSHSSASAPCFRESLFVLSRRSEIRLCRMKSLATFGFALKGESKRAREKKEKNFCFFW